MAGLPTADTGWAHQVVHTNCENVGWPQLVQAVHRVWVPLPPAQRAHAVIFTANYSEASAINNLGTMLGIHTAVGGHNSECWWRSGNPA